MSENNYGALMLKSALDTSVDVTKIIAPGIYPVIAGNASAPDSSAGLMMVVLTATSQKTTFQKESSSVVYSLINGKWKKPEPGDVGNFGTAAFCDATTSSTDTTFGRVLTVGWMGNGTSIALPENSDLNTIIRLVATYGVANPGSSAKNFPVNLPGVLRISHNSDGRTLQEYTTFNPVVKYERALYSSGSWSAWSSHYSTNNKPTSSDVGALPITGGTITGPVGIGTANALGGNSIVLGDNDTGFKQEGDGILNIYANSALVMRFISSLIESLKPLKVNGNCIATGEIHAGNGSVRLAADGNVYGSIWGGWLRDYLATTFQPKGNFTPAGQAYTKAESDARYVQDIDHTAPTEFQFWDGRGYMRGTDGAAMYNFSMVGGSSNVGWIQIRYTRKRVNGTWYIIN